MKIEPLLAPARLSLALALLLLPAFGTAADDEHGKGDGGGYGSVLTEPMGPTPCLHGRAGPFPCDAVDLLSALPIAELGGGGGTDMWGWSDAATGREFAIFNRTNGTSFLEVTDPEHPVYLGNLPHPGQETSAGDVKVYQDHAFIVGETATDHGLVVFDLKRLRNVERPPQTFSRDAWNRSFGNAHNLALNEASGFAYAVKTSECRGLHMIDVRQPTAPEVVGCWETDINSHDAECVLYRGPDSEHAGREICFASDALYLDIVDVTDKSAPRLLSRISYQGRGFVHQGWLTADQAFFLFDDESDERLNDQPTRTYIANVTDLEAPFLVNAYTAAVTSTDHNLYIAGNVAYAANYTSGLRLLHLDDVARGRLSEIGYFDVLPENDEPVFAGAWTAYPFFKSGAVAIATRNEGFFLVRPRRLGGGAPASCPVPRGSAGFCKLCGPCVGGEGRCTSDDDCAPGLVCAEDFGLRFGQIPRMDVCAWPRSFVAPRHELTLLPAVETAEGVFGQLEAAAINDAGQVVGTARPSRADPSSTAFRYTPGHGMEALDPDGALRSAGRAINEAGDVYAELLDGLGETQVGFFLHRREGGFDFLERGATPWLLRLFRLRHMNQDGDLAGGAVRPAFGYELPYVYTAEDGWRDLSRTAPALRGRPSVATRINAHGEILFLSESAGGDWTSSALIGVAAKDKRYVELAVDGEQANVALDLNDEGRIAGTFWDGDGVAKAYVVPSRGRRPVAIHPRSGFAASGARGVDHKGIVLGHLSKVVEDTLFTWDARRKQKLKVQARRADFREFLGSQVELLDMVVRDVNHRQEVVGYLEGRVPGQERPFRKYFFFSPLAGLLDLDLLYDAVSDGGNRRIHDVVDLNNWGDVLLHMTDGEVAVLSPVSRP